MLSRSVDNQDHGPLNVNYFNQWSTLEKSSQNPSIETRCQWSSLSACSLVGFCSLERISRAISSICDVVSTMASASLVRAASPSSLKLARSLMALNLFAILGSRPFCGIAVSSHIWTCERSTTMRRIADATLNPHESACSDLKPNLSKNSPWWPWTRPRSFSPVGIFR